MILEKLFKEQLRNYSKKDIFKNIPLNSLLKLNPDKKIFSERKLVIQERPSFLMQAERYYQPRVMKLFNAGRLKLENITEIEFPTKTKQLGEKSHIYGKVINRAEALIHQGTYSLSDESLIICTSWRKFTEGFSSSERRDLIKYRDYFIRVLIYTADEDRITVQEKPFLMINFTYRTSDGRLANLKNFDDVQNSQSIESIELRLNKKVFGCLHSFLLQKTIAKKGKIGSGGVRKSLKNLPDILASRLEFWKPFVIEQSKFDDEFRQSFFQNETHDRIKAIIGSIRYTDKMRIAFERILDIFFTGIQNRKAETINFREQIYNLLFVSKHSGDSIRYAYTIIIFNLILTEIYDIPSLFLIIEKRGQNMKNLRAEMNLI